MNWVALFALLARQHQVVTTRQLLALGATNDWIRWALADGRLIRLRRGVFALAGSVPSQYQALMAATLAAGQTAAASHMAAAWLWGAEQVAQGPIELTTFDGQLHRLSGVVTHLSTLDPALAIRSRWGIPTVAAPLTIVQLARTRTPFFVERVAEDLVKKHCTNFGEILTWIDRAGGVPSPDLRDLCQRALEVGGHDDSPPARKVGESMIAAGVPHFETDYHVSTPQGELFLDYAWPSPMVGLEYNGFRDHGTRVGFDRDARRGCHLGALGWRILSVTSAMTNDEIITWVLQTLAVASRPAG